MSIFYFAKAKERDTGLEHVFNDKANEAVNLIRLELEVGGGPEPDVLVQSFFLLLLQLLEVLEDSSVVSGRRGVRFCRSRQSRLFEERLDHQVSVGVVDARLNVDLVVLARADGPGPLDPVRVSGTLGGCLVQSLHLLVGLGEQAHQRRDFLMFENQLFVPGVEKLQGKRLLPQNNRSSC